jgi:hypothetical protein
LFIFLNTIGKEWLNSEIGMNVFQSLENEVISELKIIRPLLFSKTTLNNNSEPVLIYISSDNYFLKISLFQKLKKTFDSLIINKGNINKVLLLQLNSENLMHSKNIHSVSNEDKDDIIFDISFDWYILSLSNLLLAWRKNQNLSSFVFSAQKYSGTTELTTIHNENSRICSDNITNNCNRGIGTIGKNLNFHHRSGMSIFNRFWSYPILNGNLINYLFILCILFILFYILLIFLIFVLL